MIKILEGWYSSKIMTALVLAIVLGSACDHYDRLEICLINTPVGSQVSLEGITIQQGKVAAFKIIPIDNHGDTMEKKTSVSLAVENPEVLGATWLKYSSETCRGPEGANWYFVVYGSLAGETSLQISVNGSKRLEIPVIVFPP